MSSERISNHVKLIEQLLSARFGCIVKLGTGVNISFRGNIKRYPIVLGPKEKLTSIIVKYTSSRSSGPYDAAVASVAGSHWRISNDIAGLIFVNQLAMHPPLSPQLYAADEEAGFMVIEDLGAGNRLVDLLNSKAKQTADDTLLMVMRTMGALHGNSMLHASTFDSIRRHQYSPFDQIPLFEGSYYRLRDALMKDSSSLNLVPSTEALDQLESIRYLLAAPEWFAAYTHGDPGPGNWLYANSIIRLLDFEYGRYRHALLDGVVGRMGFPTSEWSAQLPEYIIDQMEASYRAELEPYCPQANDERLFRQAVVGACVYWCLTTIGNRMVPIRVGDLFAADTVWGLLSMRQRILMRFRILARITEEWGQFEALGNFFKTMLLQLNTLWTAENSSLPVYPAWQD